MTLNDLVKRVKRSSHRGDQSVTTDQITADIVMAVNDARRDVIKLLPKEWLRKSTTFATVNGTTTYSLASDCQEPLLFRYTTNNTDYFLIKVDSEREFYQQVYGSTVSSNLPRYFIDLGRDSSGYRQVQLFPTPNAAYTVTYVYYKDPTTTDLTTSDLSTAIPDLPSSVQDVLWKGALYYFLKGFDDPAQEAAYRDYKEAMMNLEIADDRNMDQEQSFRMGPDTGDFRGPNTGIRLV